VEGQIYTIASLKVVFEMRNPSEVGKINVLYANC